MIVDTGVLYALADRDDSHHEAAKGLFRERELKIVPEAVVVEADWLIETRLGVGPEIAFLKDLTGRSFAVEATTVPDRRRAAELVEQYRDAQIGYVDAVIVAMAERLKDVTVATFDGHFRMIRPGHTAAFKILP